jgi:hypothetical protein
MCRTGISAIARLTAERNRKQGAKKPFRVPVPTHEKQRQSAALAICLMPLGVWLAKKRHKIKTVARVRRRRKIKSLEQPWAEAFPALAGKAAASLI